MTSNTGSEIITKEAALGFDSGDEKGAQKEYLKDKVMKALKESFRPEFLNRIDEIIIFNYLGKPEIKKIVNLELEKVVLRLKAKRINLCFTDKVKDFLADKGFDPNLGARPLKRVIQQLILDPLALKIVTGEIKTVLPVLVDEDSGKIIFSLPEAKAGRSREKVLVPLR